jgi:F-type H+-transporting ATPase subunit a
MRFFKVISVFILGMLLSTTNIFASGGHEEEKEFDPGTFIIDHILDAYEWHIMTIGETHISVPTLIIVYGKTEETKGLHIFPSTKFHHGHSSYKGFKIETEGENAGKIVEVEEDGHTTKADAPLPLDLSITKTVIGIFISVIIMLWIFITVANYYRRREGQAPKGVQSLMEPLILFVRDDIAKPSIGKNYEKFLPYLLTIFFFIWINNMLGLIPVFPGGANVTGNIAVTAVLALFTFIITTINGNKNYWTHIVNAPGVPWWLKIPVPLMPIVEVIGVFTKPIVLMIRLFANITAGHIIMLGFFSLIFIFGNMHIAAGYGFSVISVAFTIFMTLLELLVAAIQAYVFTLLSALYFGMATEEHH